MDWRFLGLGGAGGIKLGTAGTALGRAGKGGAEALGKAGKGGAEALGKAGTGGTAPDGLHRRGRNRGPKYEESPAGNLR